MEELVYRLPFKMRVQTLMEENKAIDDRTQEDKERMEKEARLDIEKNFPSYFDEFQRVVFSGVVEEETGEKKKKNRDVKVETILTYLLDIDRTSSNDKLDLANQRRSLVSSRLKLLGELFNH